MLREVEMKVEMGPLATHKGQVGDGDKDAHRGEQPHQRHDR
jgi:hypothetical protein